MRALVLLVTLSLLGCGGAAPIVDGAADRPATNGPPRSFVAGGDLVLVLDHRVLRPLPFADAFGQLYLGSGLFRRFASSVPLDVLRDVDVVVAAGHGTRWGPSGLVASRWRAVLRHHLEEADAVARLEAGARAIGEPVAWRETHGLRSARLPGEAGRDVPHGLLLAAPFEAVIFPEDELPEVLATARDHEARRRVAGEAIEPSLALEEGVLASARGTSLPPFLTSHGATSAEGTVRWQTDRALVRIVLHFGAGGRPAAAATAIEAQLAPMRGNALLTTLGVGGWLDRLTLTPAGPDLVVETSGDATEVESLCRAIASFAGL